MVAICQGICGRKAAGSRTPAPPESGDREQAVGGVKKKPEAPSGTCNFLPLGNRLRSVAATRLQLRRYLLPPSAPRDPRDSSFFQQPSPVGRHVDNQLKQRTHGGDMARGPLCGKVHRRNGHSHHNESRQDRN